jgi:hypothetical protein
MYPFYLIIVYVFVYFTNTRLLLAKIEKIYIKVTLYDENTVFIIFYIFIDLYSGAGDLSIAASFFEKY